MKRIGFEKEIGRTTELGIGDADDTKSNVFWAPLELWAICSHFSQPTLWCGRTLYTLYEAPRLTNMKLDKDNMFQSSADSAANSIPLDAAVVKSKIVSQLETVIMISGVKTVQAKMLATTVVWYTKCYQTSLWHGNGNIYLEKQCAAQSFLDSHLLSGIARCIYR